MNKVIISLSLITTLLLSNTNDELFELSLEQLMDIEITTTSKYGEHISDSPASVYLYTSQTIHERGYKTIEDILQSLPSVDVQKFSRSLAYNDISIRGANGSNKFLILLNGVRISSPAGAVIAITNNYPIYHAKQVEVLLGAAGVIYGADAFAGVINIITQTNKNLIELQASAGQDKYLNSYANVAQNFDGLQFNAFISGFQSQEYDFANEYKDRYPLPAPSNVDNGYNFAQSKDISFFTNLKNDNYEIAINHFEHEDSLNTLSKATNSAFDKDSINRDRLTTIYAKANFDISTSLYSDTTLMYSRYEKDKDTYFKNFFTLPNKGYKYAKTDRYTLNQDFILKTDKHLISFGLSADYFNVIPRGADLPSPYDTSSSSTNQNMNHIGTNTPIDFLEYSYQNYGLYIQDNYDINNEFRLIIGARYDYNTLYDATFNPRASFIYKASKQDVIKLMYSSAYVAPGSDQVYNEYGDVTQTATGFSFRHISNPDLKPETLQTLELNYDHFFTKNTHIKVAPYFSKLEDMILESSSFTNNGSTTYKTQIFDNVGESAIYGIDLSLEDTLKYKSMEFKSWLNISYTNAKTTIDNKEYKTQQVAPYKVKAGSTMIYDNKIFFTPKLYWISETPTGVTDTSSNEKKTVPSYFLTDLNIQYKITSSLYITADVYNLFDKRFLNATSSSSDNLTFLGSSQPGRLITAGLYYKY